MEIISQLVSSKSFRSKQNIKTGLWDVQLTKPISISNVCSQRLLIINIVNKIK